MKARQLQPRRRERARMEADFYAAVSLIDDAATSRSFFSDLCTPAELEALIDRWAVARLLDSGLPYRRIHELTGVSVTTIGRVARYLTNGTGGYRSVLDQLPADNTDAS